MLARSVSIPVAYTLLGLTFFSLQFWYPSLSAITYAYTLVGIFITVIDITMRPRLAFMLFDTYSKFPDLGEFRRRFCIELPSDHESQGIKLNCCSNRESRAIALTAFKAKSLKPYPHSWEGPHIVSKNGGYNAIMAKVRLRFDESSAENGCVCLQGWGVGERYLYYIGIDKSHEEIFFHIWDKEKDFFEDNRQKWVIIGMEWDLDTARWWATDERPGETFKHPFDPPPGLRTDILKDIRNTCLFGLGKFSVRTDLEVIKGNNQSLVAEIKYIKVKRAPFFWLGRWRTSSRKARKRVSTK